MAVGAFATFKSTPVCFTDVLCSVLQKQIAAALPHNTHKAIRMCMTRSGAAPFPHFLATRAQLCAPLLAMHLLMAFVA